MNIIAFDIGGTNVKHGILNSKGEIIVRGEYPADASTEEIFLNAIINQVNIYKEKYDVEGIALSMPGFIDTVRGVPTLCYVVKCMEGKSITDILSEKTGLKVTVENDGNCVALAEKFNGKARECSNFVCITIGTGIGGGLYINDKILRGSSFKAGEFGFMICKDSTENNVNEDTMSTNAATLPLINFYKKYKGINPSINIKGEEVFEAAKTDKEVDRIIKGWYKNLALGVFNLVSTLNPDKVLIGGGVSARSEFISELEEALKEIVYWEMVKCPIEVCKHKNDAGMIGAVYNYINS